MPRCTSTASVCHICPNIWGHALCCLWAQGAAVPLLSPAPSCSHHSTASRGKACWQGMPGATRWCGFWTDGGFKLSTPLPHAIPGLEMRGDRWRVRVCYHASRDDHRTQLQHSALMGEPA
jgi:hypothetical protein